jgi:hypothetical protein
MGTTNIAAAMAALIAGTVIAVWLGAGSQNNDPARRPIGEAGAYDLQAGYTVRGQAWATELFGRRYGRHLLAAAAPELSDGEARA